MAALPQFRVTVSEYGTRSHARAASLGAANYALPADRDGEENGPGLCVVLVKDGQPLNPKGAELLRLYREKS